MQGLKQRQEQLQHLVAERTERLAQEKKKTEEQAMRLAALGKTKDRFFANISHEFRTPLTLITGPLEDLLADPQSPYRKEHEGIQRNAKRLLRLINQLLDLTKLEAGKLVLHYQSDDFVTFVQQRVRMLMPLAERNRLLLQFQTEQEQLVMAFDAEKLTTVFSNLLSNALKFTPAGGKVWVMLTLHERNGSSVVDVVVKDTGPGIPRNALPRIFDRFNQVDGSTTRAHEGTGIGLALVKELVELHGGNVLVESEEGFGSSFLVRLPVTDEEHGGTSKKEKDVVRIEEDSWQVDSEVGQPKPEKQPVFGKPKILIVEDNAEVRALLRGHLEADYHVIEAADGEAGLQAARAEVPDLVLSDVMMPKMDGYTLCEHIKGDKKLQHIPVVLLTAKADDADTLHGLAMGADDYLSKPYNADELRARIANQIASRQLLRTKFSNEVFVQPAGISIPAEEEVFLNKMLAIVEAHLGDPTFSVDQLASEVGLSRRQLTRKLPTITGEAPSVMIRRLRLERAVQLLSSRTGTISEIAYAVGFKSPSHFTQAFRQAYGVTPSDYVD